MRFTILFLIKQKKNNFEIYKDPFERDFSFNELKDKVAEVLGLSDISVEDLKHEKNGPNNIKTSRKSSTEKSQTDFYYILLLNFMHSYFIDFESNLRMFNPPDENDIQLILKQYNSKFTTNKIFPGA